MNKTIDFIFDYLFFALVALLLALILVLPFLFIIKDNEKDRLLKQCMEDGKKEYECVSLLRRQHQNMTLMPMPMIIR